ncbi:MAG: hypothetical protein QGM45_10735, partial [Anaerolineales bacterium]|nr:hypothetical protein [Anaerolineales bacterium]
MVRSVLSTHTALARYARIVLCVAGVWAATACEGAPVASPSAEPEFDGPPPATLTIDGAQQLSGIGTSC